MVDPLLLSDEHGPLENYFSEGGTQRSRTAWRVMSIARGSAVDGAASSYALLETNRERQGVRNPNLFLLLVCSDSAARH